MKKQLLTLICFILSVALHGQVDKAYQVRLDYNNPFDSLTLDSATSLYEDIIKDQYLEYVDKKKVTQVRSKLFILEHFDERLTSFLSLGFDTSQIIAEITKASDSRLIAINVALPNNKIILSYRDLISSQNFLRQIATNLELTKEAINKELKQIYLYQSEYDSLIFDSTFLSKEVFKQYSQSTMDGYFLLNERLLNRYHSLLGVAEKYETLKSKVNLLLETINNDNIELGNKRYYLAAHFLDRELEGMFSPTMGRTTFKQALKNAVKLEWQLFTYHFANNWFKLFMYFLLFCIILILLKRGLHNNLIGTSEELGNINAILHYPALSLVYIFTLLAQFLFFYAPFVTQGLFWLITWGISLGFIIKRVDIFPNNKPIIYFMLLYPVILFENLILEPYPFELWVLFFLSLVLIFLILKDWLSFSRYKVKRTRHIIIAGTFLSMICLAFLAVIFGRYNFAKTFIVTSYLGLFAAIQLTWMKEVIHAMVQVYFGKEDTLFTNRIYHNVRKLSTKSMGFINMAITTLIVIVFLRNFYVYNAIIEYIADEVNAERVIGKYVFTWYAIFTFISILSISFFVSKFISLLLEDKRSHSENYVHQKGGLKNWALLFRLIILLGGFILAFIAAGVPIDSLTIILGSLGLGIGFGLQGLVNNLISGIIIAFERPFEVNDQVEWNGMMGRLSEVGLRSSKINYVDGSEVKVPNSDLINQRLINWTHSNNLRRMEVVVGVAYDSDVQLTNETIQQVLREVSYVRHFPPSQVLLNEFASSSVNFRVLFWVDIDQMLIAKNDVLQKIHERFGEKGIVIAFPQLDVHFDTAVPPTKPS